MTRLKRLTVSIAIAALRPLGVVLLCGSVSAATATANVSVSAPVSVNCTVTAGTLAFGAYDPVVANAAANLDGSGTFTVACTKSASGVTIDLGQGGNYSGGRRLVAAGNFLSYQLYSDGGRSTI